MKILVLGGTGAIGNDLVRILAQNGNDVYVTSRSTRESKDANLIYIKGNAADDNFLKELLKDTYFEAIVDFMSYSTDAFRKRYSNFLKATDQYVYFSSSRVYAESTDPITENSARLLDVCQDEEYVQTDEYALAKARQEDLLRNSGKLNWTIIRPYITYSDIRLQLGFQEKEVWLYRALHGRSIVFNTDIADKTTTLTWGRDVAETLATVVGNKEALGQAYHITQTSTMKWKEVLEIYSDTIEEITGNRPNIILEDSSEKLSNVSGRWMQRKYDRLYNRVFDNSKISELYPDIDKAISMKEGLKLCLTDFLKGKRLFRDMEWKSEGYMDKVANEYTPLSEIPGVKNKMRYLLARYTEYFENR